MESSCRYLDKHEEPASVVKGIRVIEKARMVIQHLGNDTIAFVPGMLGMVSLGHFTEKYDKFAYSAIFPFSVSHSAETVMENAPDVLSEEELEKALNESLTAITMGLDENIECPYRYEKYSWLMERYNKSFPLLKQQ